MVVPQSRLAEMLIYSFVLGVFWGGVYDVFRIRRLAFSFVNISDGKKKTILYKQRDFIERLVIFFEDILYWLICSVSMCIFIYYINSGRFRGVSLIGAFFGFFVYYKTIGKLVMLLSGYVIRLIKTFIRLLVRYTVYPIVKLLKFAFNVTLGKMVLWSFTGVILKLTLKRANNGFGITRIKGKIKNEKSFKYIRKSGSRRVHSVLHGNYNSNAV